MLPKPMIKNPFSQWHGEWLQDPAQKLTRGTQLIVFQAWAGLHAEGCADGPVKYVQDVHPAMCAS